MNRDRKENGQTVDQMLEQVRLLIVHSGYQVTGPTADSTGGYHFQASGVIRLQFDTVSDTWRP
jgi:hypothetical protein